MSPQFKSFALLLLVASSERATGQGRRFSTPVAAGSELERYLRANELVDSTANDQWTIRPLAARRMGAVRLPASHSWRTRVPDSFPSDRTGLTAPSVELIGNSAFPYGFNDGPVWAGKGMTAALSGGVDVARRHFAITLQPTAFIAQNASFSLVDNGLSGDRQFADPFRPDAIDVPQRFGSGAYGAVASGESEIAVRGLGVTGGISSRAQVWGPAYEHPLILGNNAGGVPRLFAGTDAPLDLRWITIQGQVIWGQVNESAFGPDTGISRRHFVTGAIGTVTIKRVPGLELGLSRFFHATWPSRGALHIPWLRVLQGFISDNPAIGENPDNQLASGFIRVAPPGAGFEIYGEYGREDRAENYRDVPLEPDHDAGYTLGFARAWATAEAKRLVVLRGEVLNTRISHLQQQRGETPWYMHTTQPQGHTERGQILGSVGGFGGGASNVAWDRYTQKGRTTIRWDRIVRGTPRNRDGLPIPDQADVIHAIGAERMSFTGPGELTVGAALTRNFNRYLSSDATNVRVSVGYRLVR